ncbi:MIP family channel protein [Nocardioides sp. InS609-2]|uniref:MIP family channel protein n=1 Tax=Nocardioides sp. InS609-2 TaxID=2760705 RepID=UPI0020C09B54|nr:MIP family channel protein [Nocardioides sp. InS609-2]
MTTTTTETPTTGQKFAAEVFGTFGLVFFGCGTAMLTTELDQFSYVGTALAFGLAVLVMAYAVGRISGGHFNPAVTLGAALGGRLAWREVGVYVGAQLLGGLLAGAILFGLFHGIEGFDAEGNMAQNSFGDDGTGYAWWAALILELLLTAIFVWVILAVTDARNALNAGAAPLAIGLALTMIHLASIGFTGTSVNPARSIGVGVFAGTDAIIQLWLFIVAPLVGAAIAGLTYPLIFAHGDDPVAGSGLRLGGGRNKHQVQQYPGYGQQQWGQPGAPQQWGQPGTPQQWGQQAAPPPQQQQWVQQPAAPAQQPPPQQPGQQYPQAQPGQQGQSWGQPAPGQQPGTPQQWGTPDADEDGRTQIRPQD